MNSILKDVTERNGNIGKGYYEEKRKLRVLAGICVVAMTVTSLPYTAMKVSAEPEAAVQQTTADDLKLWYTSPADITKYYEGWQEKSLPIGNGAMGGTVFGGITRERIQLNEKSLWSGGPSDSRTDYNGGNLTAKGNNGATLTSIHNYFSNGQDNNAINLANNNLIGVSDDNGSNGYGYYLSFGNMYIDFKNISSESEVENYSRDLDLKTAIAGVNYDKNGTSYSRENFTSYPDNVIVTHITADGSEKISLDVSVEPDNEKGGAVNKITTPSTYTRSWTTDVSEGLISVNGTLTDNQMKFTSQTKVITDKGGTVTDEDGKVSVSGASEVTIITSMGTDYKNEYPKYRTGESKEALENRVKWYVEQAEAKGYDKLKADHISDYQKIFNRVDLDLGQGASSKTTDTLLSAYNGGSATEAERRYLEVLLFQYGRFMTIESSRETRTDANGYERETLPSNLQGLWVGANNSPWHSDYHMNVNLQMNYWPTYSTNMAECAEPLINYVDSLRVPGRITAAIYAGVFSAEGEENGFMAHTQNNPFGWTCPGWDFSWGWSPAAVPWILQNCWDYYEYTGDVEYLKNNIYPMMKEEAKLYDRMLVPDSDGKLISSPAFSPEHGPITNGNTYEQTLIWQLYEDTIKAAEILGTDAELVTGWKEKQAALKGPIEIGSEGQIKEWYTETTLNSIVSNSKTDGYNHRHISHMLGLFPGDLITEDNAEWFAAAKVSMQNRTDVSTGWAMAQRINSWARLGEGNKAYELIKNLFSNGIYANLFDYHDPQYFQIDGNFGYTSGVTEMLLQSNAGYINFLPAVPDDWAVGSVSGLVAQGNFEVGMNWSDKVLRSATIKSNKGGTVVVQAENIALAKITDNNGDTVTFEKVEGHGNDRISIATTEGGTYTISDIPSSKDVETPTGVEAIRKDTSQVEVSWNAITAAESSDVSYNVYRKVGSNSVECIASGVKETTYMDTSADLTLGTIKYQVSAVVNGVESVKCDLVAAKEAGTILMQVKPSVLQANAICNTQQKPEQGKDGLASWAFDEEKHWWHTRYAGDRESGEDNISKTTRPWIGSGFGQEIRLKKITYTGRTDQPENNHNNIIKYSLYYADMEEPTATPASGDWVLAKTGYFTSAVEAQDIVLEEAVKATHFKLVAENTNNWANNDTAANGYHGAGSNGGGDTSAENIKVYAEDTLNLTVKAPIDGEVLGETENAVSSECAEEAVVEDVTDNPIDTTNAVVNSDGTFSGQITGVDDSKLDVLSGNTPFMIRAKVKLNAAPTGNHVLINRGGEPYQIAYGKDDTVSRIKFQMRDTGGTWHETKVCVTDKIGQEIDILALYTGSTMGLWVDGERCTDYSNHNSNADSTYTMRGGAANALKIGESGSPASIESIQIVNNIGTVDSDANYNSTVIPAFNKANELLNIQIVKKTHLVERTHNYTLATKWVDAESQTELTKADTKTVKKYNAVAIATPADPLVFIEDSVPETINVNVDGTNVIEGVPVTSSSVDENGVLTLSYKFEDLFIGGSLRMDYGKDYTKTSMRFGYDFALPEGADFTGCEWYYGTTATALTHKLAPTSTKYITNPGDKGEGVYRSNIVFTNLGSANYASDVYARVLVKYTLDGKNYSKMGSFIDTRTVEKVAREIQNSDKATQREKDYAENILKELAK